MIHQSILSTIGRTPLVAIRRLNPHAGVKILAKIEFFNPGGSIKDRVAMAMVEAAEASGELTPDKTLIEATSGNTGIGLAMVCAVKGYRLQLLMPASASEERRRILLAYGADIHLTPGHLGTDGAIEEAYRLAREKPEQYVLLDQYNNPASIEAHYRTTAQEIWDDAEGGLTHVVVALGTSGTAMGTAKRLKELDPAVRIVAVEPLPDHKIQGLKNMQASYPPGIYNKKVLDGIVHVEDEEAFETSRRLAREEGIFVGMSSGAAMAAALRLAGEIGQGVIVAVLPDGGDRYLSTTLFAPRTRQGLALHDAASAKTVQVVADVPETCLFTAGPPLDEPGDLEAWRRIALLDCLARHLRSRNLPARMAVGLADLDDRTLAAARQAHAPRGEFSASVTARLESMAQALGMTQDAVFHRADACTDTALALCRKLLGKGAAYEKLRSVYFDVLRYQGYGRLSHMDLDKLSLGKTVDLADYVKQNPKDFTLLKRATLADLKAGDFLPTEWGNVRPSWFLQHAATAQQTLANVSVVLTGQAQRFPHMENFGAIWALGSGREPQVWLVSEPVTAKAEAVPGLAQILESGVERGAMRLWLLSTWYRKPLVWSPDSLAMWRRNWQRAQQTAVTLAEAAETSAAPAGSDGDEAAAMAGAQLLATLGQAMEDDLSIHRFWPALLDYCREIQQLLASQRLSPAGAAQSLDRLRAVDSVVGILDPSVLPLPRSQWPPEAADFMAHREAARQAKDFRLADTLRAELEKAGFRVEDTPLSARLYRRVP